MSTQPAIYLEFEPASADSKIRAFKGRFDFNQVCADNSPYIFTTSMLLSGLIVGDKQCNELGRNRNDFASFLASTAFYGNVIIYPNRKSEIALDAIWKKMKTCTWIKQNPNVVIFEEEEEEETDGVITASVASAKTSSNIVNKKRIATSEADSEQIEYVEAYSGPQPQRHGKTQLERFIILEFVYQQFFYSMYFIRMESQLCSLT